MGYVATGKPVLPAQVKRTVDRRLRVNFGVLFLDNGALHAVQPLFLPRDNERAGEAVLKSLGTLENLLWTGDAVLSKVSSVGTNKGCVGICQTFLVRQASGSLHPQRDVAGATDGNGVGCSGRI